MTWEKFEIGNFVELRQGLAINKSTQKYLSNEVTYLPLLRIGDMKDGNFNVFINDSVPEKFIAKESDIIYTRTGKVGLVFRKQYGVIHNNCFTVSSKDESILIQEFLYYVLQEKSFYEEALSRATGAAQPDLPHGAFSSIEIFLPPIDKQKNIVEILNAYNDLIENNQKQIKLLEEAVQRLYKEWFVDLRFPGYETTPIIDGVPEGWETCAIKELCQKVNAGGTPKRGNLNFWNNGTIKWYKTGELKDSWLIDSEEHISVDGLESSSAKLFPKNTIIMAIYASPTLGRLGILSTNGTCNQAALCFIANEKKVSWQWLYQKLYELRDEFNAIAKGAGQQNISADLVKEKIIILPPVKLIHNYTKVVESLFDSKLSLQLKNKLLQEARDRLLPKLMNGELEV